MAPRLLSCYFLNILFLSLSSHIQQHSNKYCAHTNSRQPQLVFASFQFLFLPQPSTVQTYQHFSSFLQPLLILSTNRLPKPLNVSSEQKVNGMISCAIVSRHPFPLWINVLAQQHKSTQGWLELAFCWFSGFSNLQLHPEWNEWGRSSNKKRLKLVQGKISTRMSLFGRLQPLSPGVGGKSRKWRQGTGQKMLRLAL